MIMPSGITQRNHARFGKGRPSQTAVNTHVHVRTMNTFTYRDMGLPVTVRHGSRASGRRLGLRRRSPSAAFCHIRTCVTYETNLQQLYGDRCYAASGPKLWNCLLADLRQAGINFQRCKRLLNDIFVPVLRSRRIVANC